MVPAAATLRTLARSPIVADPEVAGPPASFLRTSHTMRRPSLLVLLLLALPVSAQTPPFFPPQATQYGPNTVGLEDAFFPADFAGGHQFGHLEVADMDGDERLDTLVLSGTQLIFLPGVDSQAVLLRASVDGQLLDDVSAFTVVGTAGKPLLAVSDGQGTRLLAHLDGASFSVESSFGAPPGWADLLGLEAVDSDGDGLDDLFGLSATGLQVHRRQQGGPWLELPSIDLPLTCGRLAPLEWDGDHGLEVAVAGTGGLRIMDHDPVDGSLVLYQRNTTLGPGHLARVRHVSGTGHDRIAWLVFTGVHSVLSILGPDDGQSHVATSHQPSSLDGHDLDGDGDTDLVISQRTAFDLLVLEQLDGLDFDPETALQEVDLSPGVVKVGVTGNNGPVAAADVDEDGQLDLVTPSLARGSLVIATDGPFTSGGPSQLVGLRTLLPGTLQVCQDGQGGSLELSVRANYTAFPGLADGWRISVWEQERGDQPPQIASTSSCSLPLDVTWIPGTDEYELRFRAEVLADWLPPFEEDWIDDLRLFHIKAEPVLRLSDATALDDVPRGPPLLATLSCDLDALGAVPVSDSWIDLGDYFEQLVICQGSSLPTGDQPIGGFYSVKRIPTVVDQIPVLTDACLIDLGPPGDGDGGDGGDGSGDS